MNKGVDPENDPFKEIARNMYGIIASIVLTIRTIVVILLKQYRRKVPLNYFVGLVYTLSLTYAIGAAVYSFDVNAVISAFILTIVLSLAMAFFGA